MSLEKSIFSSIAMLVSIIRRHAKGARNASLIVPIKPSFTRMCLRPMNRAMTRRVALILGYLSDLSSNDRLASITNVLRLPPNTTTRTTRRDWNPDMLRESFFAKHPAKGRRCRAFLSAPVRVAKHSVRVRVAPLPFRDAKQRQHQGDRRMRVRSSVVSESERRLLS